MPSNARQPNGVRVTRVEGSDQGGFRFRLRRLCGLCGPRQPNIRYTPFGGKNVCVRQSDGAMLTLIAIAVNVNLSPRSP